MDSHTTSWGEKPPAMFENLRQAFKEAVDNFKDELNRDDVPEVVDGLLRQMQEEVTDAQAHAHTLEAQIKKALQLAELEEKGFERGISVKKALEWTIEILERELSQLS